MKKIRIGNDIAVTWTVTSGTTIDLDNVVISLYDQYGDEATISDVEIHATGTTVYRYDFTFYGMDQKRTGVYRVLLQRNDGEQGMVTLDHVDAFQLVGVCDFGIVEGQDEDHVQTVTVELESALSTSVEGEGFDPTKYYTKEQTNELLAGKENLLTFDQTPTNGSDNPVTSNGIALAIKNASDIVVWYIPRDQQTLDHTWAELEQVISNNKLLVVSKANGTYYYLIGASYNAQEELVNVYVQADASTGDYAFTMALSKSGTGIAISASVTTLLTSTNYTSYAYSKQQVNDLLATKIGDAPSDGKQYARKDGAWSEVEATGGGLTIVPVASGTTAITAEAGMYYRLPDNEYISELAITLPTIASTETMVQDIKFSFTTSSTPNVVFGATDANAQIKYYDGFAITGNNAFEVKASYNGTTWIISEIKKSGGAGPAGYGEEVTVMLTEKNGDVITPVTSGMEVTVIIDGQSTVYTSDPNGIVAFRVPYGLTYTVTAGRRDGWYISQNAYALTYTAGQATRSIVFQYRSYSSGLYITTAEGDDYTLEEWQEAVAAGTKTNAEALYIHVVTADLIGAGGTFLVGIDMIRDGTFSTYRWNTQQSQFNSIPLTGNNASLPYYYDGYGQTIAIKEEGQTRILEIPAFDYVTSLSITVDNRICPAFIGSYGQWVIFWSCIAEVDDILLSVRPNGTYLLSTFTAAKWTSSQSGAGQAYVVNGPFSNSQTSGISLPASWKATLNYVIPFFAF